MNKVRFTTYMTEELMEKLKNLSEDSRVPISRYIDEAVEELLKKYENISKK